MEQLVETPHRMGLDWVVEVVAGPGLGPGAIKKNYDLG